MGKDKALRYLFLLGVGIAITAASGISVAGTPPDACALATAAEVSTAFGYTVTRAPFSVYDDKANWSVCNFSGEKGMIMLYIQPFATAAAAQKEFATQLAADAGPTTTRDTGVGDGAFDARTGATQLQYLALQGSRLVGITVMGNAANVPHDRVRTLLLKALSR